MDHSHTHTQKKNQWTLTYAFRIIEAIIILPFDVGKITAKRLLSTIEVLMECSQM
jgi:hypothetical protein